MLISTVRTPRIGPFLLLAACGGPAFTHGLDSAPLSPEAGSEASTGEGEASTDDSSTGITTSPADASPPGDTGSSNLQEKDGRSSDVSSPDASAVDSSRDGADALDAPGDAHDAAADVTPTCVKPELSCGGQCIAQDANNCGQCDYACPSGFLCMGLAGNLACVLAS